MSFSLFTNYSNVILSIQDYFKVALDKYMPRTQAIPQAQREGGLRLVYESRCDSMLTAALRTIGGSVYFLFVPFVWLSVTDLSPFWLAEIEPSIRSPRHISAELKRVALHLAVVKGYKYKKIQRITGISERKTQCVQALHRRLLVVGIFQGIFSMVQYHASVWHQAQEECDRSRQAGKGDR